MVKRTKAQIKKEPKASTQPPPSPPLLMHTLDFYSQSQKHGKKDLKSTLQEQTKEFLKNHSSKVLESPLPSPPPSPSAVSTVSSYTEILTQVRSQAKAENLRQKILELEQQLQSLKDSEDVNPEPSKSQNHKEEVKSNCQLFGKHFKEEEMELLSNEIYCKKRIRTMAEGCSYKASHVARRMLEGVYKREALIKYTFSGKSKGEFVGCLDRNAKNAIVDFSMNMSKKRGWESQTRYDLNRAMSQKISEIKRTYKSL